MKKILLVPEQPFYNYVDIAVLDFPDGKEGEPRQRCKVRAEFAQFDVSQLKKRGMDYTSAIEYYEKWLYDVVKINLAQDWQCVGGWEEVMDIIKEKVSIYY